MDELVKRLRNRRICIQQSGSLDDFPLLREAADAIEELSKRVPKAPHGRLIDADALLKWARERDDGGPVNWVDSLDLTIWADLHTIIPPEEGET